MRVLVIEDHKIIAESLAMHFREFAEDVIVARTMAEADAVIATVDPIDVFSVDLVLPDSGLASTIKRIKEIKEQNPTCLLLVISGMNMSTEEQSLIVGSDGFIDKRTLGVPNSFFASVRKAFISCIRSPDRYHNNLLILEKLTVSINSTP